ncbi:MAG: hypothetical protein C4529_13040 [Deltaproteobacteria bacterium]|nr:MAG: hypothetical protein C4529_13040 [Deltaproteobacteria bacterium]
MPKNDELKIVIRAQDFATREFDRVSRSITNVRQGIDQFKGGVFTVIRENWLALTAAVWGFYRAVETSWRLADKAAKFHEQKASLDALAKAYGTTADAIIADVDRASKGLVRTGAAVETAGKAMLRGLQPEQIANLAAAAETLSNITGDDVTESFQRMTEAISLGRERGIESAAVVVDLRDKYGDLVVEMSEAEKRTKLYEYTMEKARAVQELLGDSTDSLSDRMERFQNQIEVVRKTLGEWIIRAGAGLMATFQSVAALALGLARVVMAPITALMLATDYLGITQGKADEYKAAMEALGDAAQYTAEQANDNFKLLFGDLDKIAPKAKGTLDAIDKLRGSNRNPQEDKNLRDAEKRITEMYQQYAASRARTESEFTREKIREFESGSKIAFDKLPNEYRNRFLAVVKADWEKIEGERLKAQEQMFRAMEEQAREAANKVSQAESEAATNAREDAIRAAMRMDDMYLSSKEIDEVEATNRRYANEKKLLEIQKERLLDSLKWTDNWEDQQRIGLEYARITEQIRNLEREGAYAGSKADGDRMRERLNNARRIQSEIEGMYLAGSAQAVQGLRSAYEDDLANFRENVREKKATWAEYDAYARAREHRLQEDLKKIQGTSTDGMKDAVRDYIDESGNEYNRGRDFFNKSVGGMESAVGDFLFAASQGTFKVREMFQSMGLSILKAASEIIAKMIALRIVSGLGSIFAPASSVAGAQGSFGPAGGGAPVTAVAALGGIFQGGFQPAYAMPGGGSMPFRAFSSGGIVRRPTVGLVGEGGQNEAVVPLPDGKAIPVKMQGGDGGASTVTNNWNIVAMDTQNMDAWLASKRSTIEGMMADSLARAGLVRDAVRRNR